MNKHVNIYIYICIHVYLYADSDRQSEQTIVIARQIELDSHPFPLSRTRKIFKHTHAQKDI